MAELPASTAPAAAPGGAIAVVDGRGGWPDAVREALRAGALAVVVDDPAAVRAADIRVLAREARVPVVANRPCVRASDAAALAESRDSRDRASAAVIEVMAARGDGGAALRDAAGWLREVLGAAPRIVAPVGAGPGADAGGVPVSVLVTTATAAGSADIVVLAPERIEIGFGAPGGVRRLAVVGERGRFEPAPSREAPLREALRRCLAALADGARPDDLARLADDAEFAEAVRESAAA